MIGKLSKINMKNVLLITFFNKKNSVNYVKYDFMSYYSCKLHDNYIYAVQIEFNVTKAVFGDVDKYLYVYFEKTKIYIHLHN